MHSFTRQSSVKLMLDHVHNSSAINGVKQKHKCYTALNSFLAQLLQRSRRGSHLCDQRYFKLQNDNIFILFQKQCQFIKLRSTACHFCFPACRSLSDLCDRAVFLTRMPPFLSPCFTSLKSKSSLPAYMIFSLWACAVHLTSAAPETSMLLRIALLMQQLFQSPVS